MPSLTDRPTRQRIKWTVAGLLDKLPGQCWADLVFWVFGDRRNPWSPMTSTCRTDFERRGACYCGKLRQPAEVVTSAAEGAA
jgi:hypothetical protein